MKKFILLLFLFFTFKVKSQDLTVVVNQTTINKLFEALDTIKGEGEYQGPLKVYKYNWQLTNTHIQLLSDSAIFVTQVTVDVPNLPIFRDEVKGKVTVSYDEKTNLITIKVIDAKFQFALGNKARLVLKTIQLADYFTDPLQFEGPANIKNNFSFQMPNGETKKVILKTNKPKLKVLEGKIVVTTDLNFIDTLQVKK